MRREVSAVVALAALLALGGCAMNPVVPLPTGAELDVDLKVLADPALLGCAADVREHAHVLERDPVWGRGSGALDAS